MSTLGKMKDNNEIKLTNKQERFCYEYCIDFNATQAAIRAGYNPTAAYATGYENLKKPQIKKQKSLDSISKMLGFDAPVKQEITGKDGKNIFESIDLSKLSQEELTLYYNLLKKANG